MSSSYPDSYARMRLAIDTLEACDLYTAKFHPELYPDSSPTDEIGKLYIAARGVLLREWNVPNPETFTTCERELVRKGLA